MAAHKTAMQKLIDYMEENYHLTEDSRYEFKKALKEEIEQIKTAIIAGNTMSDIAVFKRFKKALLEAAKWQEQLTEFESTKISFSQARQRVINRIFKKLLTNKK